MTGRWIVSIFGYVGTISHHQWDHWLLGGWVFRTISHHLWDHRFIVLFLLWGAGDHASSHCWSWRTSFKFKSAHILKLVVKWADPFQVQVSALSQVGAHCFKSTRHTCILIYIYIYINTFVYTHIYICIYICVYINTCICIYSITFMYSLIDTCIHTHLHMFMQTQTCVGGKESCVNWKTKNFFRTIKSSFKNYWLCVHRGLCWCLFLVFSCFDVWRAFEVGHGHGEQKRAHESIVWMLVLWSIGE